MLSKYSCPKYCPERRTEICHTDKCEKWTKYQEIQELIKTNRTAEKQAHIYAANGAVIRKSRWQKKHKGRPGK